MSQYIVSARKYRPDTFETLIGQDNIAQTLKNSILRGQLAHAYLFCGPRGVGKTSTARIFAKAINCSNPGADMEPCGECESCLSFKEGRSYCIHELDAASNNGVDDIKALMDQVQVPPQVGKYSVYIIDEVHMLTQQAFNAFLKTLEEPPAHAIFILATTEKHKILPTILSRCQTYDFNRITIADIVRNLRGIAQKEGVIVDDESLHIIAQKADGAMRDALTIFDQTVAFCGSEVRYEDVLRNLNVLDYEYSFSIVDAALSGDYASSFRTFDEVLAKGFNAQYFVSALSSHLRDLVVSKTAGLESLLNLPDSLRKRYQEQAGRCSIKYLYDALNVTTACEAGYKASINQRLHIEFALMKLCFLQQSPAAAVAAAPQPVAKPVASAPEEPVAAKSVAAPSAAPSPAPEVAAARPSSEPAAAPVAAPRRRARSGASLSINALMSEGVEQKETVVVDHSADVAPSEDAALKAWPELAKRYDASPRLYNALLSSRLSTRMQEDVLVLTFMVDNEAQRSWIESTKMMDMEGAFRQMLGTSKVKLSVEAAPVDSFSDYKYTAEEKAKDLIAKNPEVGKFVKEFSLDV